MKRVVALLGVLIAAWVGYAAYALNQFADGVRNGDAPQIAAHVDFPAVRASLKEQANAALLANVSRPGGDLGGRIAAGLAAALGPGVVNNLVDTLVTPAGFSELMQRDGAGGAPAAPGEKIRADGFLRYASIVSPTQIRISDGKKPPLLFSFTGGTWKLTGVELPPDLIKQMLAR
ncbi:MAG: DUF2939 domain-containing protein [Hyphomicrobiales bacterium]|nr:DUF2939 domain-containing protein [Hyphomicrobiales bacterium]